LGGLFCAPRDLNAQPHYAGRFGFKTIKPAAYPAGPNTMRPAHIHFQVSGQQGRLVTQMYFEGDPYNNTDRFLQSAGRTELLITKLLPPTPEREPRSELGARSDTGELGWA
jgi:protocatechuate 3,4-dioxygenase, beta subunit